jgi:glycosyltransferase involved in cell wall biosynthesis
LGKGRICTTAWYEIDSTAAAGADLYVIAGDSVRPFPRPVRVETTFSWGKLRLPYQILGTRRMCILHDKLVARKLPQLKGKIDIIHAWPLAALHTIRAAKKLGIPVALERCNAHTRFAYEVVRKESERIGVPLPPGHEHAFDPKILALEEAEYAAADALLCPSDFTAKTFLDAGFPKGKLVRFIYGVDEKMFHPSAVARPSGQGFKMIYVGVAAVRKGLHFALEAWLNSPASKNGEFLVVGGFIPAYREKLAPMLAHPSVKVLGHRNDVPALMRDCDAFVMPSIEEGFGLVCTEAIASGCVPLVSDACTDLCRDEFNSLVHAAGDVAALTEHINRLNQDRMLLSKLREQGLRDVPALTWEAAGHSLIKAYQAIVA